MAFFYETRSADNTVLKRDGGFASQDAAKIRPDDSGLASGIESLAREGLSHQGVPVTTWKLLRAMIEHEVHHCGEIYVYLALLGVPRPPLNGVTEPELRRLSMAHD